MLKVIAGLRHNASSSDDEEDDVHAPPTQARMLRTKRSCPGTSTKAQCAAFALGPGSQGGEAKIDGAAAALLFFQRRSHCRQSGGPERFS